jgi:CheY-like chemotaxis protein
MSSCHAGHSAGATVLLVDDEEGVRDYCRRVLEETGARVVEAADGQAALRLVQSGESPFDLVLTDLLMPVISGREVAEVLSVFRPDLPVLGISADPGATQDRRLPVLQKPFTREQLIEAVARTRLRSREIRSVAEEKRARARLLQAAATAAQLQASQLVDHVDLVAVAIELRRLDGNGCGN